MRTLKIVALLVAVLVGLPILLVTAFLLYDAFTTGPGDLARAIKQGDVARVRECLAAGIDPNYRYHDDIPLYGYMPLHVAAGAGQLEIAQLLVEAGADPNGTDRRNVTPLLAALGTFDESNRLECVKYFLRLGNAPDHQDYEGYSALHGAVSLDQPELVKLLLEAGADPNQRSSTGFTPLHRLCNHLEFLSPFEGGIEVFGMLVDAGGDPYLEDDFGNTPIGLAKGDVSPEVLDRLVSIAGEEP